jgi:MFS family permease
MADCKWYDPVCKAKDFAASTIGDALTKTADAVLEAVGKAVASLGTMWVNIGTPTLTGGGGSAGVSPGDHAANVGGINTILGWATWIAFGICVLSLMVAGVRMGLGHRHEGQKHVDRLGVILVATIIISASVGLVTAIAPAVSSPGSPTVAFIQNSLWWYMIAVAVIGVIFGAVRMAWEQRAEPGKDLVKSLLTLVVVSGAGLTAVSLLVAAGDSFSVWLLNGSSLGCDIADTNGTCFGGNMAPLLALTTNPTTGGLGAILIIVLGLLAIIGSVIQILLMIVRAGMLVVLAGVLPVSAAATNTETGRNMFRKTVGWLLAFILYKPAAAIVYATAFKLSGTSIFKDDGSGLISVIVGLTLMAVALVALPALMSLIVPAVSSIASGSGMAMAAVAGAAMLPSGAVAADCSAVTGAAVAATTEAAARPRRPARRTRPVPPAVRAAPAPRAALEPARPGPVARLVPRAQARPARPVGPAPLARAQVVVPPLAVQQQEEARPPLVRPLGRSVPLSVSACRP